VTESCAEIRRRLEAGGAASDADAAAHIQACEGCRAHAAILAVLGRLEPPQADPESVRRVMAALPPAAWQRRRLAAWLPLAAGLALVASGLVLLGGIPAATAVAGLPAALGGVLGWIVSSALDALAAARGGAAAARMLAAAGGAWFVVWLALTALGGGWAVVSLVARARAGGRL
jgi:hypothetical protein